MVLQQVLPVVAFLTYVAAVRLLASVYPDVTCEIVFLLEHLAAEHARVPPPAGESRHILPRFPVIKGIT